MPVGDAQTRHFPILNDTLFVAPRRSIHRFRQAETRVPAREPGCTVVSPSRRKLFARTAVANHKSQAKSVLEIRPAVPLWYVQWIVLRASALRRKKSNRRKHEVSAPTLADMLWIQKGSCNLRALSSTTSFLRAREKNHPGKFLKSARLVDRPDRRPLTNRCMPGQSHRKKPAGSGNFRFRPGNFRMARGVKELELPAGRRFSPVSGDCRQATPEHIAGESPPC